MNIQPTRLAFLTLFIVATTFAGARGESAANGPASPAASQPTSSIFARSNIAAWCIVPYDGKERGPAERAEMLERIGLSHFAYDWRAKHLPSMPEELDELAKHHITLDGVWFPDSLNADARFILDTLAKHHVKTQLWVMSGGYEKLDPQERVKAAMERMRKVADEAVKVGCTLGVYNHGGWFGEPANQVAVVKALKEAGVDNVGIVYNLHHGYGDLDQFDERFAMVRPYLLAVNLNGMSKVPPGVGEPVVPVGQGDLDLKLLKTIRDSGYTGPIGIINESKEDAEIRLLDNLDGLAWLAPQLDGKPAGDRPQPRSWHRIAVPIAKPGEK